MTPNVRLLLPVVASLVLVGLDTRATLAQSEAPSAAAKPARHCFSLTNWRGGWRAPTKDVIYLRVDSNDIWRLDLNGGSPELLRADVHLVNIARGGDTVCAPIDLDLFVSDNHGFRTPLFVKSITKLTPEQVAALPAKQHP
jgi:hypothetical protein